ncbi:hypothetical protein IU500_08755 [Nocardia terpenica]|uniref:MAB_1171c family putative transporter n=1 Tax=Nocardia terpenica TaxID=455432 RepID=UPI0018954F12|nr:MAB_1171c family putative transporter [Nocardia terpenica]MBF6060867.1 hypothetical protein [Nocardia terpenica]MBF6104127.1 hypothetical protein [Nocardia terpenica]MBF6111499.1 hypothetical protein [Nocardia terpenica]MBF6118348.1 hypothetical protein [Nocardia terpenica]MBF6155670.1 hypothetical protein [Nocardia terpenica]
MSTVLYSACVIGSILALLLRLPALRRNPEPGLVALCCYFGISAFTFVVAIPAVWAAVNRSLGLPNLTGLLSQCGGVSIAVAEQAVVLAWAYPWEKAKHKIYHRLALLLFALAAMAFLFTVSLPRMIDNPHNFVPDAAKIPTYAAYLVVFQVCFLIGTLESVRLCWRYSLSVGPGWLRRGLRTAAVGSGLGLPYSVARFSDIFAAYLHGNARDWEPVARGGASIGTLLLLVGWTMPSWGPRLSGMYARVGRYRTFRRLGPLWRALYDAVPEIALTPPQQTGLPEWPWSRLDFRLYRRIVEIRDARMTLLPHFSAELADAVRCRAQARGLTGRRLEAIVEAANLAAAIAAKKVASPSQPLVVADDFEHPDHFGENLHDEMEWLTVVGRAFTRSSLVAEAGAAARASTSLPTSPVPQHNWSNFDASDRTVR